MLMSCYSQLCGRSPSPSEIQSLGGRTPVFLPVPGTCPRAEVRGGRGGGIPQLVLVRQDLVEVEAGEMGPPRPLSVGLRLLTKLSHLGVWRIGWLVDSIAVSEAAH